MIQRYYEADTIAAVSTAVGPGGIGIVRISGPDAVGIAERVFRTASGRGVRAVETHCLVYGRVVDPADGAPVDEALLAVMRAPRTYTREDVVELHCHGGVVAQRAVLRLVLRLGARLAEPGEFTRRAFLNGRIDLAQAESVAAIVGARTSGVLRASVRQLDGGLSEIVRSVRQALIGVLAQIEASVDFADEDVDDVEWEAALADLSRAEARLAKLVETASVGRALDRGVHTAIVGRPNVGKSSLLNALLMRQRAIVSEVPGTTRDTVEELVDIGGIPFYLVDTAGLRTGGDHVEQLGVARSRQAMEQADVVVMVVDAAAGIEDGDRKLLETLDPARTIVVGNKVDLWEGPGHKAGAAREVGALVRAARPTDGGWEGRVCTVSALKGEGLDGMRAMMQQLVTGGSDLGLEDPILASERHRVLISEALERTRAAVRGVREGVGEELVAEDVRAAAKALGDVTGEEVTTDLLDEIFGRFCLGK